MQRLLWLPRVVVACANVGAATNQNPKPANLPCQLLLYPRYHLDHSSLLACYPLAQVSQHAGCCHVISAQLQPFMEKENMQPLWEQRICNYMLVTAVL